MPLATAAALPPEEPPGVRSSAHGLRVVPNVESHVAHRHNSGTVVEAVMIAPASRRRGATTWSRAAGVADVAGGPLRKGRPATGILLLTSTGRPAGRRC